MDPSIASLPPGDPKLISAIGNHLKSQGLFDQFRKQCLSDIDTKPAYQNLRQRVEGYVANFLQTQQWRPDLNKNQLRDSLRRHINESGMLAMGVDRIVEQVVNPKVYQAFYPQIESVVFKLLGKDLPTSGSFMQKCLDSNVIDTTNPEVPGEEKDKQKDESEQESLQKIIGFTDEVSNASTSAGSVPEHTKETPEIKTNDAPVNVELDSPPMKASVETQTENTPSSESASKDGLTTDSNVSDDGKESSDKKKVTSQEGKKDHHKKSVEIQKVKTKDPKKEDKKPDKVKSDKTKHSGKHKTDSKVHSESKNKSEDSSVKVKKLEGKSGDKDKNKSTTSDSKSPKIKTGEKHSSSSNKTSKSGEKSRDIKSPKTIKLEKSSSSESEGKTVEKSKKSESVKSDKSKEHKKQDKSTSKSQSKHKPHEENKSKIIKNTKVKSESSLTEKSTDSHGKNVEKIKTGDTKVKEKEKSKSESHSKDSSKHHGEKSKTEKTAEKIKSHDKHKNVESNKSKPDGKSIEKSKEKSKSESHKEKVKSESDGKQKSSEKIVKKSEKTEKIRPKPTTGTTLLDHTSKSEEKTEKHEKSESKFKKIKVDEKDKKDLELSPDKKIGKRKHSESDDKLAKKMKSQKSDEVNFSPAKSKEEKEKEKDDDDAWSDVTVSSVHTSDLSDYDDHITLTDSEVDKGGISDLSSKSPSPVKRPRGRPRKDQSIKMQQTIQKQKKILPISTPKDKDPKFIQPKFTEEIGINPDEPKRELRRQRKVNPRYSSDEFASIFSKGKDKLHLQHDDEEYSFPGFTKDDITPVAKISSRGHKSSVSGVMTDHPDNDQPYSPRSDISEFETHFRRQSKERESGGRPISPKSDMSADSSQMQGPRTPESTCSTESKRRQHYDSSDLYKPRPTIRGGRRNRGSDQRYDDSDLYKPRPQISSRRARGSSPKRSIDSSPIPVRLPHKTSPPGCSPEGRSLVGSPVESTATTPTWEKQQDEVKEFVPATPDVAGDDESVFKGDGSKINSDEDEEAPLSPASDNKRRRINSVTENLSEPKRRGAPRGRRRKSSSEFSTRGRGKIR